MLLDLWVKEVDIVALEDAIYGKTDYRDAASQAFQSVLQPYFNATNAQDKAAILKRVAFSCNEDLTDPSGSGKPLSFPVQLQAQTAGVAVWHRYSCSFAINYQNAIGQPVSYRSPKYAIHQLDLAYGKVTVEPAVAFQNYNWGSAAAPAYPWLGRYVQPLDLMLRDHSSKAPQNALAGVNGGYDYRVDAWAQTSPSDNICPPRYTPVKDRNQFYSHPPAAQCPLGAGAMPSCAAGSALPWTDDMGDSLVYLPPAGRAKSWRTTPFQSYNCGGVAEAADRGALILYPAGVAVGRTSPNTSDVAQLRSSAGDEAVAGLGAGPLLVQDGHFVYDELPSEESMPIDNYEIGGATGAGFSKNADGSISLHLVNIDGHDNSVGVHDWLLGLYFLSPAAASDGAVALGNGGDATFWINPQAAAVQAVLRDPHHPNHAYFKALFVDNGNPGVVSNCSGFAAPPISCSARPVHDGLFVYSR